MTCTALEYRKSTDDDDDQEDDGENEFQFVRSCTAKAKELENLSIQTQYDCATSLCDPLKPDDEIGVKGWSFIIFIILAISIALCFFLFSIAKGCFVLAIEIVIKIIEKMNNNNKR